MMPLLSNLKNPIEKIILSSPLHGLLSDDLAVIRFTDQRSGRVLSLPVEYQLEKRFMRIVCSRKESCWRNFSYGSPVEILIRGVNFRGWAELIEDETELLKEWSALIRHKPDIVEKIGFEFPDLETSDFTTLPDEVGNFIILRIDISNSR
jgi:hypothetical protein